MEENEVFNEQSNDLSENNGEVINNNETIVDNIESNENFEQLIGVYVKKDEQGNIIEVNSDIFITDFTGWEKIAEGYGDKYAHAQSQWFEN